MLVTEDMSLVTEDMVSFNNILKKGQYVTTISSGCFGVTHKWPGWSYL